MSTFDGQNSAAEADAEILGPEICEALAAPYATASGARGVDEWTNFVAQVQGLVIPGPSLACWWRITIIMLMCFAIISSGWRRSLFDSIFMMQPEDGRRYQCGCLYKDHGAWYVRYREQISHGDGSSKLIRISKHLGWCEDFSDISAYRGAPAPSPGGECPASLPPGGFVQVRFWEVLDEPTVRG
jgi:hypothetical protein